MTNSLVMIHPFDPWGSKVGGIETAIRSLIKYAPPDFSLSLIGVTENSALRSLRQWTTRDFEGVNLSFYPLFEVETPNQRTRIPLFLRFALALRSSGLNFPDAVAFYHRIEPICVSRIQARSNLLYLHSDPREWIGAHSEVRWKYIPWLYRSVEREAVRKSDWVFGVSRSTVQYLQERYPERGEQFFFLPSCYRETIFFPSPETEVEALRQKLLRQWGLPSGSRLLLFAGRLEAQKNPLLAVEALARLHRQHPAVHLIAAGEGSQAEEMQKHAVQAGVQQQLHFLGSVDPVTLSNVMKVCDLLLMTSRFEGMPITVMEALACGTPVVSTDTGEVRHLIQSGVTGEVVDSHDPDALARSVMHILTHRSRYEKQRCVPSVESYRTDRVIPQFYEKLRILCGNQE